MFRASSCPENQHRYRGNELTGPIPSELGSLVHLTWLELNSNELTGSIPPELGNLISLESLYLNSNRMTGPIPRDLGSLTNLAMLELSNNQLSGQVPHELGNLANLWMLSLESNRLTGPLPSNLGSLRRLRRLWVGGNELTGPIPSELGSLTNLYSLELYNNQFTGQVPSELGQLGRLERLLLNHNTDLSGPLPASMVDLRELRIFSAAGTSLCAPSEPLFQMWLEGIENQRIASCEGSPTHAYLIQATQSLEYPVPLVSGEEALLRVFVTAPDADDARIPPVRARFYRNNNEVHVAEIPAGERPIPDEVVEGNLATSANASIPGSVVQPGLEMVIEVDPDGTLDSTVAIERRIPRDGRLAVEVRRMPTLNLTLIPFLRTASPDSSILGTVLGMAADPQNHELLRETADLLPVGDFQVTAHDPVLTTTNDAYKLLSETEAVYTMEGATGHYMGMMSGGVSGAAGVAWLGGRMSFSVPRGSVIAHELGHNFSLLHAPCGNPKFFLDDGFPYLDGSIGAWGYAARDLDREFPAGRLVPPTTPDLMSYCGPEWISDYGFTKALRFRLEDEGTPPPATTPSVRSLLLWGGVDSEGAPYLEPALVADAAPVLPMSGSGAYELTGVNTQGGELFSLTFDMQEIADGDGSSSFVFTLPVSPAWARGLESIVLTGPGGSAVLDASTDRPLAVYKDRSTGQVRGILRGPAALATVAADGAGMGTDMDVLFSRGLPGAEDLGR